MGWGSGSAHLFVVAYAPFPGATGPELGVELFDDVEIGDRLIEDVVDVVLLTPLVRDLPSPLGLSWDEMERDETRSRGSWSPEMVSDEMG